MSVLTKRKECVMRISPISISPARNYQNLRNQKNVQNPIPQSDSIPQNPSFKGWGGALGTILGAAAGVGLAVVTGGASLAVAAIPAISGSAAIAGDIIEHSKKSSRR